MDFEQLRIANLVIFLAIAGTLSWRHVYYQRRNGIDNLLRSATDVLVTGWLSVGSGVAYDAHQPVLFTTKWLTLFLLLRLTALWTPWRWHMPKRD